MSGLSAPTERFPRCASITHGHSGMVWIRVIVCGQETLLSDRLRALLFMHDCTLVKSLLNLLLANFGTSSY